jgi:hypothetical protein
MVDPLSGTPPAPAEDPVARADYLVAVDIIKLLSDIRFRCLVFVTAIVTVANALLPTTGDPGTRPTLGLLGLLATLGITIYELRNSQLYEAAMHRAKTLERRLGMKGGGSSEGRNEGLFVERPPYVDRVTWDTWARANPEPRDLSQLPLKRFWFVPVKHDHGLALIYGAALGAWVYLFVYGVLALPVPADLWRPVSVGYLRLISALLGISAAAWSICQFFLHDKHRVKKPLSEPAPPEPLPAATGGKATNPGDRADG